jgi:DNA topoisomerase VI subunit B
MSSKTTFAEISPSEFFYRNRDLAGFTNPARALYMAVRELVENSMDAAELSGVLPEIYVRMTSENSNPEVPDPKPYRLVVIDNWPGVAPQRFGCLCQSDNVSFIRNLWINNQSRNPKAKGTVQYINNIVYNWGVTGYVGGPQSAGTG